MCSFFSVPSFPANQMGLAYGREPVTEELRGHILENLLKSAIEVEG